MEKPIKIGDKGKQCKVCELPGEGVHWGVYSCGACASAFRYVFLKNSFKPCRKNRQCSIVGDDRRYCSECRLRKCLDVGMRYKNIDGIQNLQYQGGFKITNLEKLLASVMEAHLKTSHRTDPTFDPRTTELMKNVSHICCAIYSVPARSAVKVAPEAIKGVEEFGRKLLSFVEVPESNQDTLLKEGVFGVLLVRLACTFNSKSNTLTCWNGRVIVKGQLDKKVRFFWFAVFDFAERVNQLNLSDEEVSLFCLVIVVNACNLNWKIAVIAEIYKNLMDILTDFVKNSRSEDSTNFFTVFTILLFQINFVKEEHKKLRTKIEINPSGYSSVPYQYTEYSSLSVSAKGSPPFLSQQSGYQPPFDHQSTASVDESVPYLSSSRLSNPIVHYSPSVEQDFSMPPAKNAELKRISRQEMESSSEFSWKKSYASQDQKNIDGKKLKCSEDQSGSSTDYYAIYNEGLRNMHLYHPSKQLSFSNPIDRPPIATEVSETFPSGDMPLCLSSNSITMIEKEDSFLEVVSEKPGNPISNSAKPEKYHQKSSDLFCLQLHESPKITELTALENEFLEVFFLVIQSNLIILNQ